MNKFINVLDIYPEINTRENFSHVPELCQSIKENGLQQPITVVPGDNVARDLHLANMGSGNDCKIQSTGKYMLIAGESRWRSHVYGKMQTVEAIVRNDIGNMSHADRLIQMGTENESRKEFTETERYSLYSQLLNEGLTIDDICQKFGKTADYIERRLAIGKLKPEYQRLCGNGNLPITYAFALSRLNSTFQPVAFRRWQQAKKSDAFNPTIKWFNVMVGELEEKQNQQAFNFGLFGGGDNGKESTIEENAGISLPTEPTKPQLKFTDGGDNAGILSTYIQEMAQAAIEWEKIGMSDKSLACSAIVAQMHPILDLLQTMPQTTTSSTWQRQQPIEDKILRLLGEHGELTKSRLTQYTNKSSKMLQKAIDKLCELGKIYKIQAGRGYRYQLA